MVDAGQFSFEQLFFEAGGFVVIVTAGGALPRVTHAGDPNVRRPQRVPRAFHGLWTYRQPAGSRLTLRTTELLHREAGPELGVCDQFLDVCGGLAQSFERHPVDVAGESIHVWVITNGGPCVEANVESFAADGEDHGYRSLDAYVTDGPVIDAEDRVSPATEAAVVRVVESNDVSPRSQWFISNGDEVLMTEPVVVVPRAPVRADKE